MDNNNLNEKSYVVEEVIRVDNAVKIYKKSLKASEITAVDNLSISIKTGEVVGLLGPNGAGKSTLIKMISGLANPTSGHIEVMGYDIKKQREVAMAYVGAVIESPDMYASKTAQWVLEYFASLHDRESLEGNDESLKSIEKKADLDKARIKQVLDLVGLSSRNTSQIKTYSMGMKQRLGIAQALLNNPKLLILDEPANGLDPSGIKEIRDLLRYLADEHNMGILVSSHQLAEMQLMCDRVIIINKGKLIKEININNIIESSMDETPQYILFTDNNKKATDLLKEKFDIDAMISPTSVIFKTDVEKSKINKELVLADIAVEDFKTDKKALEDIFLEATNSEVKNEK